MFFGKKDKDYCEDCGTKIRKDANFCHACGAPVSPETNEGYGMLGKKDSPEIKKDDLPMSFSDKIFGSLIDSMFRSLDKQMQKQFKEMEKEMQNANIEQLPNGIRIKIGGPSEDNQPQPKKSVEKRFNREQINKISKLPKTPAKTNIKRLGDKLIYELTTPGVNSIEDIAISKLESGYEIKAISDETVYVNNLPVNLPIRKYSIGKNKISFEFIQIK